jgi:hypothetical protein
MTTSTELAAKPEWLSTLRVRPCESGDFYVYGYFEPDSCEPFYVGKGKEHRAFRHIRDACRGNRGGLFYNKLRKMHRAGLKPDVLILAEELTEAAAFDWERHFIAHFGRRDIGTGCLCNHTDGGEGRAGSVISDQVRRRLSESHRGKVLPESQRRRMSEAHKGRKHSEVAIRKMAIAKSKWPIEAYAPDTGHTIHEFISQSEARRAGFNQGNIGACLKGRRKTHKGLGWRYTSERAES